MPKTSTSRRANNVRQEATPTADSDDDDDDDDNDDDDDEDDEDDGGLDEASNEATHMLAEASAAATSVGIAAASPSGTLRGL